MPRYISRCLNEFHDLLPGMPLAGSGRVFARAPGRVRQSILFAIHLAGVALVATRQRGCRHG
jgi:hypothetical protein